MSAARIFQQHLQKNLQTGKLDWKPGTPSHIRAAGKGYKSFINETATARLPHAKEQSE
jgi:hypothetical protein